MNHDVVNEQQDIIFKLQCFKETLQKVKQDFHIDTADFIEKVNKSIRNIKNKKFSIAFFGAYSDGKSTIISALTKRLDIKISPKPTTDKVVPYEFNTLSIIDTPGLFSNELMHDEITRKYISEANVVIYTVDSVNPLKDSHKDTVRWILRDIEKAEATIFVINKMDEIADLEEEDDYNQHATIKQQVVCDTISEYTEINAFERIVCISADPYGEGLDYWLENEEEYLQLSRINELEKNIQTFLERYKENLITQAGISVIKDACAGVIHDLSTFSKNLKTQLEILNAKIKENHNDLSILDQDVTNSYLSIKEELLSLRSDIISEIDAATNQSELAELIQQKMGKDCYVLQEKINIILERHTNNALGESKRIFNSIDESVNYYADLDSKIFEGVSDKTKTALKMALSAPTRKIADATLKIRNLTKIPFKFKPWGAMKFAKFLKFMPVIMEFLDFALSAVTAWKLNQKKQDLKKDLEAGFQNFLRDFTKDSYIKDNFPRIAASKDYLKSLQESEAEIESTCNRLNTLLNEINSF